MPDSFGKRQRRDVKARKAAARDERRVARNQRREDRAAGVIEPGPPLAEPEPFDDFPIEPQTSEPEQAGDENTSKAERDRP